MLASLNAHGDACAGRRKAGDELRGLSAWRQVDAGKYNSSGRVARTICGTLHTLMVSTVALLKRASIANTGGLHGFMPSPGMSSGDA